MAVQKRVNLVDLVKSSLLLSKKRKEKGGGWGWRPPVLGIGGEGDPPRPIRSGLGDHFPHSFFAFFPKS